MTLTNTLYLNDTRYIKTDTAPKRYVGFRCLHYKEGGFPSPIGMPNVRRAKDAPPVDFTPALQEASYALMLAKNPTITRNQWEAVFDSGTAFNNNGHGVEGDDPKLMDGIICAGMFIRGDVEGGYLVCRPGVHALDAKKPIVSVSETVSEILRNGWYFVANTGQGFSGAFHFPQGNGGPVYILYALESAVRYPLTGVERDIAYTNFEPWDAEFLPDPLRFYRPK